MLNYIQSTLKGWPLICPQTTTELAFYYTFWVIIFFAVNFIWDYFSPETERPKFHDLNKRAHILQAGGTCASSFLVLFSILDEGVRTVMGDVYIPLIMAGGTGVLSSIVHLSPHSRVAIRDSSTSTEATIKPDPSPSEAI